MNTTFRNTIAACALGMACGSVGPALAGDAEKSSDTSNLRYVVTVTAEDLSDSRSVEGLYSRIKTAVNAACRNAIPITNPATAWQFRNCISDLTDDAVEQAGQPQLSYIHENRDVGLLASR